MKTKLLFSSLVAAVALLASGCLEHRATLSLKKDGSGTLTEETLMSAETVAMMESMAGLGGEGGAPKSPLASMADKAEAEKKAKEMGEGVTVEKVETIDENGRKGARVVYAFEDVNKLKYGFGDSMSKVGEGMNPAAEGGDAKAEPMAFSYKDGVLTLKRKAGEAAAEAPAADPGEVDPQQMAMMQQVFKDMKMSLKIECPGGIEETNASHVDGSTVTLMELEFGKLVADPEKFKKFAAANPQTPAEMQAAAEGIEGLKVETKEELTIRLK